MTTVQVQVRVPKRIARELDKWISEGRFANRSEAIKTVLTLYEEREKTREFYQMLLKRSEQARKKPDSLILLEEIVLHPKTEVPFPIE
jgi:Arc/MetJ-type ribon-helix-helix transcriptional regulator